LEKTIMNANEVSRAKKIGGIVGGIAGGIAALVAVLAVRGIIQLPFGQNSVESQIERFANEANKGLPKQIDEFTRWDHVEPGPQKSYSYIYTINRDLTPTEKESLKETVSRTALAMPDLQATFAAGVTVWYRYYDSSGKCVLEFSVKK
jgi:hypothetical protein